MAIRNSYHGNPEKFEDFSVIAPKLTLCCYFTPVLLIGMIWVSFFVSPEFFLNYILSEVNREFQIIEIVTFLSCLVGGILLMFCTVQLWKQGWRLAALLVSVYGLATLFFAGEEVSWGQSYFFWDTPDWWDQNVAYETNFHNSRISVWGFHTLAGLFQLVMFGIIPGLWFLRDKIPLMKFLGPAIPELPVISMIFIAFLYRECKNVYMWFFPHDQFFQDFIWGLNEHREMLVALALLFYAIYRTKAVKQLGIIQNFSSPS